MDIFDTVMLFLAVISGVFCLIMILYAAANFLRLGIVRKRYDKLPDALKEALTPKAWMYREGFSILCTAIPGVIVTVGQIFNSNVLRYTGLLLFLLIGTVLQIKTYLKDQELIKKASEGK